LIQTFRSEEQQAVAEPLLTAQQSVC